MIELKKDTFSIPDEANKIYFTTLYRDQMFLSDNPDELAEHTQKTIDERGLFLLGLTGSCFYLSSPFKRIHAIIPGTLIKRSYDRLVFRNINNSKTTNTLGLESAISILNSRLFSDKSQKNIFDIKSIDYKLHIEKIRSLNKIKIEKDYFIDEEFFESLPLFPFFHQSMIELIINSSNKYSDLIWLCGAYDIFESTNWNKTANRNETEIAVLKRSFLPKSILESIFSKKVIRDGLSQIRNYVDISTQRNLIDHIYYSKIISFNNFFQKENTPIMPYTDPKLKLIIKSLPENLINNNHVNYYILRCMMNKKNPFRNLIQDSNDLHKKILDKNRKMLEHLTSRLFNELNKKK